MSDSPLNWTSLGLDAEDPTHRRTLIEASAGTGKTWTISVLYLRFVTEQERRASQIVVTTFTDAAAQELRERIRSRLQWALSLASGSNRAQKDQDDDPEVREWLRLRWDRDSSTQDMDALRLRLALSELDLAPIGTIHSLCRKILTDQPFASGSPFRIGEMVADSDLIEELADDLVRVCAHSTSDDVIERAAVAAMLAANVSRSREVRYVLKLALSPANVVNGPDLPAFRADLAALEKHAAALTALAERSDWRKKQGTGGLERHLANLASAHCGQDALCEALNGLDAISKAPKSYVNAAFVDEFEQSAAFQAAKDFATRHSALKDCLHLLPILMHRDRLCAWRSNRLEERNQFTFDELIEQVYQGTAGAQAGRTLADRLFTIWPVALIDEFQDTDARQYAIFNAVFSEADGASRGQLIMIGDPKQAIYSFRGGDIQAYLGAARRATQTMTLARNFRSSTGVIQALNALYAAADSPFGMNQGEIIYEPVTPAGIADKKPLVAPELLLDAALQLEQLAPAESGDTAEDRAMAACAERVVAYLQPGQATIGGAPVQPKHMAILMPKRKYIGAMRDLLASRGVPCVGAGNDSIFETEWATELRVVLHALLHVSNAGALRAALATRLIGCSLPEIRDMERDLGRWKRETERFATWASFWREHGVLRVIDQLIEEAAPGLLAQTNGERAMTDLRHLGELLQAQSQKCPGREQLLAWLTDQCEGDGGGSEQSGKERELRIESDEKRVQIMTLHASKGLEFDIVMLPLMWKHDVIYTSPKFGAKSSTDTSTRIVDVGSPAFNQHIDDLKLEQKQERLRVLYVALTRARHACHVTLPSKAEPAKGGKGEKAKPLNINASGIAHLLDGMDFASVARGCNAIRIAPALADQGDAAMPVAFATAPRVARLFNRWLPFIGSHSFSTLTRKRKAAGLDDGGAANDENDTMRTDENASGLDEGASLRTLHPLLKAMSEVRGAKFGNALHAMFEHRDNGRPMIEQLHFVRLQLAIEGVRSPDGSSDIAATLATRIDETLATDLGDGLRLCDLAPEHQRAEMAFNIMLSVLQLQRFEEVCTRHGHVDLLPTQVHRRELRGFLTGKIDLVLEHGGRVHVLDYKSNWLGDAVEDYVGTTLDDAMHEHGYPFQALLYVMAVDRYLRQRKADYVRERDLGDAIYLFVRAVGLGEGAGIWRQRFSPTLIAELEDLFEVDVAEVVA